MNKYKIRFNQHRGQPGRGTHEHAWRVFEGDTEYIVKNVKINVPSEGKVDEDGLHWNIVCYGSLKVDKETSTAIIDTCSASAVHRCY